MLQIYLSHVCKRDSEPLNSKFILLAGSLVKGNQSKMWKENRIEEPTYYITTLPSQATKPSSSNHSIQTIFTESPGIFPMSKTKPCLLQLFFSSGNTNINNPTNYKIKIQIAVIHSLQKKKTTKNKTYKPSWDQWNWEGQPLEVIQKP